VEQISTCSPWKGPHAGAGGCLKEAVAQWGDRAGTGSCQDLQTRRERRLHWSRFAGRACDPKEACWAHNAEVNGSKPSSATRGPMLEQPVPEVLHPVGGTHAGAVHEELYPVGRTRFGEVCGELSPLRGTFTLDQGKSVRSLPLERQEEA